jgi:hypothetical protein
MQHPAKVSRRKGASDRTSRERFTLRVLLVFHPAGVTIKVGDHGWEISAVPLEPRDKPQVLPMRRLRAVYLCKLMNSKNFAVESKRYICLPQKRKYIKRWKAGQAYDYLLHL